MTQPLTPRVQSSSASHASPSGPHPSHPIPREQGRPGFWGLTFPTPAKNGVGLVSQEPSALVLSLVGPLRREGVSVSPAGWPKGPGEHVPVATTRLALSCGTCGGWGAGERLPLAAVLSSSPRTRVQDQAAQRTCAGLLSYYTWATPVTVKATPSAVSTSSQRGCNVIISREILPRNAKQGHGSGGAGPGGVGKESSTSLLQLRPGEEGGGRTLHGAEMGVSEKEVGRRAGGCRWPQGKERK